MARNKKDDNDTPFNPSEYVTLKELGTLSYENEHGEIRKLFVRVRQYQECEPKMVIESPPRKDRKTGEERPGKAFVKIPLAQLAELDAGGMLAEALKFQKSRTRKTKAA